jgi:hypothetical protein
VQELTDGQGAQAIISFIGNLVGTYVDLEDLMGAGAS